MWLVTFHIFSQWGQGFTEEQWREDGLGKNTRPGSHISPECDSSFSMSPKNPQAMLGSGGVRL